MRSKKRVTDAVRDANRENARASCGPKTTSGKSRSSMNATRHSILGKRIMFRTEEQRSEFKKLEQKCREDFEPRGILESFCVDEIITVMWKLEMIEAIEAEDLLKRKEIENGVIGIFNNFSSDLELPIKCDDLPVEHGLDCERIVVRGSVAKDTSKSHVARGPQMINGEVADGFSASGIANQDDGHHLEVEVVLISALESMSRYKARLKKDLYRAIEMLRTLQTERKDNNA